MFVEQPPLLYRLLMPGCTWRLRGNGGAKRAYLTFDDGPIPEVTPWVLDVLDRYGVKATFFMVGDNARRHPELVALVRARGHSVGNHSMHHLQGLKCGTATYLADIAAADELLRSRLYRPPHGLMWPWQLRALQRRYRVVMHDVVSRDYARDNDAAGTLSNVRRYTRDGSVIVFHDSLKAERNMRAALPLAIEWLLAEGYELCAIGHDNI